MKVELLLTGNELMSGDTVDSNSVRIAKALLPIGLRIHRRTTVGDDIDVLLSDIETISKRCDLLIINGGLGPTKDDLTAEVLSEVSGFPLIENPEALEHLNTWCASKNMSLNDANLKQAFLPKTASVVANPIGSAVGIYMRLNNCDVICTPGVPSELSVMLRDEIVPLLAKQVGESELQLTRLQLFGIGESRVQQKITDAISDWPQGIELGFRAGLPFLELKLISTDKRYLERHLALKSEVEALLADFIVGEDDFNIAEEVIGLLKQQRKTIVLAESCTGGLIASLLTSQAGASEVFPGGFVSYSNEMKTDMLDVSTDTLAKHGAVSEAVVQEMLNGALKRSGASCGIAVSGIAGPTGGSVDKPVGTAWVAWGSADHQQSIKFFLNFGRSTFQTLIAAAGLDLVRRQLLNIEAAPQYFKEVPGN